MIEKNDIVKLLNKYGFDSFTKEPFLYASKDKVGIYYTLKDPLYGYLNRVFLPNSKEEAENFLKNYYAYKKQNKKNNISINLLSYNDPFAIPFFKEEIEQLNEKEVIPETIVKSPKQKRKLRTAYLLIEIVIEKISLQNATYINLEAITAKYRETKNEWTKLKNEYEKTTEEIKTYAKQPQTTDDTSEYASILKKDLEKCNTDEEVTTFITNIIDYLKNLEKSESLLKNKYYLITTPLQIDLLEKQITIMKELLKKKKRFSKKENLKPYFDKIEEKSEINKVVSLKSYIANEQKRIDEKYMMISDMDYRTIADYLIEFDNLKINEPKIDFKEQKKEIKKEEQTISFEQTLISLEEEFASHSTIEQTELYILTSFLKYLIRDDINKVLTENIEETKEAIQIINNPNNLLAKIKLFKEIETSNPDIFIASLKKVLNNLENIKPFILKSDINVFFQEEKILTNKNYLFASSKKNSMPIFQVDTPITYIATLKKDSYIYFTPKELMPDLAADEQLVLKDNRPIFIIDTRKNIVKNENSDIIKVARFQIEKKEVTNIITVTELKSIKIDCYKKIEFERRKKNE